MFTRRTPTARVAAVSAFLFALSGCAASTAAPSEGPTVITFWSSLRGADGVVEQFNATHDDIHVEFTDTPSGAAGTNAMLYNSVRAGNAPDVATLETNIAAQFALDGVLEDITDDISPEVREAMLPQAFDLTTFDGRTYALTLDIEPMMMFYREDMFRERGVEVPTTWAEYREAAEQFAAHDSDAVIGSFFTNGDPHLAAFAWQTGDPWFAADEDGWRIDMTGDGSLRVADYWQGLIDDGLVDVLAASSQEWNAAMANDQIATYFAGAWAAAALRTSVPGGAGNWRVAPVPRWDGQDRGVGTHGGSAFGVPVGSEHPQAALEFIEWMITDPEAMRARIATGTSSMYPSITGLVDVARETFDPAFYGGQDVYSVFEQAAQDIPDGWIWGPRTALTAAALNEDLARVRGGTTIGDALEAAQAETYRDMTALGLEVREGDR